MLVDGRRGEIALARTQQRIAQAELRGGGGAAQVERAEHLLVDVIAQVGGAGVQAQARRRQRHAVVQVGERAAGGFRDAERSQVAQAERIVELHLRTHACRAGAAVAEVVGPDAALHHRTFARVDHQAAGAGLAAALQRRAGRDAGQVVDEQHRSFQVGGTQRLPGRQRGRGDVTDAAGRDARGAAHDDAVGTRLQASRRHGDFQVAVRQVLARQVGAAQDETAAAEFAGHRLGDLQQLRMADRATDERRGDRRQVLGGSRRGVAAEAHRPKLYHQAFGDAGTGVARRHAGRRRRRRGRNCERRRALLLVEQLPCVGRHLRAGFVCACDREAEECDDGEMGALAECEFARDRGLFRKGH